MNDNDRDAIFRRALSPRDDVHVPNTLADEIHRGLLTTPQLPRTRALRWMPALSPATFLLLLLTVATLVAGAALFLARERDTARDMLSFRGDDGRTGQMAGPAPRSKPIVEWQGQLARQLSNFTMPLVMDGGLYVVDTRGNAVAIDLETGRERWSTAFPSDVSGTPLIAGGLLIAPADDGVVRALSLETGETVWTTALGVGVASSVGGSGDLALIGAEDGALHALDTATGEERWSVEVGEPIVKAPAIADGMAYVVSGGDAVAVDVSTGEIAWRLDGLTTDGFATPVSHDGVLYLAHRPAGIGVPGEIIALDVSAAGESDPIERWRWQAPTTGEMSVGAAGPEAVYAISADGKVYRIDPATGIGEPYLTTGAQIGSPISLVDETLYVGSQDGRVYAVDRSSGSVLWSREAGGLPLGPVAADGRLIVSTEMGRLVSLVEAPDASPR